jgi:hypothetical protein
MRKTMIPMMTRKKESVLNIKTFNVCSWDSRLVPLKLSSETLEDIPDHFNYDSLCWKETICNIAALAERF